MPNIDSISVSISADASRATKGIDDLIQSLDKLNRAVGAMNGVRAAAASLEELSKGLSALNQAHISQGLIRNIGALSTSLQALSAVRVDSASLTTLAESIDYLSAMKLPASFAGRIGDMATALGRLGGVSWNSGTMTSAAESIDRLAGTRIRVSTLKQISDLASALDRLSSVNINSASLMTAGAALEQFSGIRVSAVLSRQLTELSTALHNLQGVTVTGAIFTSLAAGLSQLAPVRIPATVSNQITRFTQAVMPLMTGTFDGNAFYTMVNALNHAGSIRIPATVSTQVKRFADSLTSLNGAGTIDSRLGRRLNEITTALSNLNGVTLPNNLGSSLKDISKANSQLNSSGDSNNNGQTLLSGLVKLGTLKMVANQFANLIHLSNQYQEDLNLFTASLGKYAEEAKQYAETVSEALGIDPSVWLRNQGVFQTLITGFGVVNDRAYTMSKNLTQLGYDLSSYFNITVEDAMQKLQSGIAGELEPLRRLGYDLSEARLKAIALEKGITSTYREMTQAEKSQLRYEAILSQVTVAQGDMARTLNAPANQLRILSAQLTMAGREIGNVFIPMLNAILPPAIAVVKAIREIAESIASLFGFTLTDVDYSGITDTSAATEDLTQQLDNTAQSAKEAKKQLMGFDEINQLKDPSSSGTKGNKDDNAFGSNWDWDLSEYDFLGNAITSRVADITNKLTPYVNWIKDHIEDIGVGLGGILLWANRIGKEGLTSLKNFAVDGVSAVVGASLSIKFENEYLDDGQLSSLGKQILATALGISGGTRALTRILNMFRKGQDNNVQIASGLTFSIGGVLTLIPVVDDMLENGVTFQNAIEGVIAAAEIGIGACKLIDPNNTMTKGQKVVGTLGAAIMVGGVVTLITSVDEAIENGDNWLESANSLKSMAGIGLGAAITRFSWGSKDEGVLKKIGGSASLAAGVILGVGALVQIKASVDDAIENSEEPWQAVIDTLPQALEGGLAVALTAAGLGANAGLAAGLGMLGFATVAIGVGLYVAHVEAERLAKIKDAEGWGDVEASAEDMQRVAQALFDSIDIDAKLEVGRVAVTNLNDAKQNTLTAVQNLQKYMSALTRTDPVTMQVTIDPKAADDLYSELTTTVIPALRQQISAGEELLKVNAVWGGVVDTSGAEFEAELIAFNSFDQQMLTLGESLGEKLQEGLRHGFSAELTSTITALQESYQIMQNALLYGNTAGQTEIKRQNILNELSNWNKDSVSGTYQKYLDLQGSTRTELENDYNNQTQEWMTRLYQWQYVSDAYSQRLSDTGLSDEQRAIYQQQWEEAQANIAALTEIVSKRNAEDRDNYVNRALAELFPTDIFSTIVNQVFADKMGVYDADDLAAYGNDQDLTATMNSIQTMIEGIINDDLLNGLVTDLPTGFYNILTELMNKDLVDQALSEMGYTVNGEELRTAAAEVEDAASTLSEAGEAVADVVDSGREVGDTIKNNVLPLKNAFKTAEGVMSTGYRAGLALGGAANTLNGLSLPKEIKFYINLGGDRDTQIKGGSQTLYGNDGSLGIVAKYAKGGLPPTGSVFVAGEKGPELVGMIGNKTAVVNDRQIADTVAAQMENNPLDETRLAAAIVSALRTAGMGAVYLDGRQLANSINAETRRIGRPAIQL